MSVDTRNKTFYQGLNSYSDFSFNVITLSDGKTYVKIDQDGNKSLDSSDVVSHNVLDTLFNFGSDTTDSITTRALFDTVNGSPLDGYFFVVPTASELAELSQRHDFSIKDKNWFSGYVWSSTEGGSADTHIAVINQGGVTSQLALSDQTNASVIIEVVNIQSETARIWRYPYLPNVTATGYSENGVTSGDRLSNSSLIWVGVPDVSGAVLEVTENNGRTWSTASNSSFQLLGDGDKFILTRQRFSDGSLSIKSHEFFTLDTEVKAPALSVNDMGIVTIAGLDEKPWKWEYSIDQGVSWNLGQGIYWWQAPQNWTGSLSLAQAPNAKYVFRQTDAAGNTSQTVSIQYSGNDQYSYYLTGSIDNDILLGAAGDDTLDGGSGNDSLDGRLGNDTMIGGIGNDTFTIDDAGDVVVENENEGIDTIESFITKSLAQTHIENITLLGSVAVNATGNAEVNILTGNAAANTLSGLGGNDTLKGGAGNDVLDGGSGIDTADFSDKTLSVTVNLRSPAMTMARVGNVNEDRLRNIENLIGGSGNDSLTGNGLINVLSGGSGDDTLDGGGGADSLVGGAGNDTFIIDHAGEAVTELAGDGIDLIRTTLTQFDLIDYDHVENLTYTGRSTAFLFGSDLDNVIKGGSGADGIWGGFGSDTLYGGDGADFLMGFFDNYGSDASYGVDIDARIAAERLISPDVLYGGKGNDIYIAGDEVNEQRIVELKNEGTDIIFGSYTEYVLSENVENYCNVMIQMDVSAPYFEIFGNSLNNVIQSSPDWSLMPAFADHNAELQWTFKNLNTTKFLSTVNTNPQIAIERFFGMAGNDTLLGGAGDDYLSGGEGRDRLTGGTESDQFVFDAALNRSTNVDTITDFVSGQDKIVLNSTVFSRFSLGEDVSNHFSATGRALDGDDYLIYSASNKTLYYDADGNGGSAAVAFAVLTGVSSLSASDFLIV